MAENSEKNEEAFSQKKADSVAQSLNVVFNNATFYGGKHPSTQKCAMTFASRLDEMYSIVPMVTLLRTGDSLYIEKWCVDHKMNVERLINTFRKTNIESISFENGTTADDVKRFIGIFSDLQTFPRVEEMSNELQKQGVSKIRFNYVFYQQVTKDEAVVDKDLKDLLEDGSIIQRTEDVFLDTEKDEDSDKQLVFDQIGRLFSYKDLLENPTTLATNILTKAGEESNSSGNMVSQLKEINEQIRTEKLNESNLSADEIMESVFKLTTELKQGLTVQKEMGKIVKEEEQVINEVDRLTYQAIIQVVKEEYKKGKISVKRLSQIIRRILPDIKDLKKLLPQLKEGLLAEGMSLTDFLQLTKELNKELEADGLMQALEEGAEQIGLSVEEIVQAINNNPNEAAKIIVLASEIKQETGSDQSKISKLLSEYIESISSKMALESPEAANQTDGQVLKQVIHQIESQLVDKLKTQDVSDSVINEVEKQLAKKFPKTLKKLQADWIVNTITNGKDLSGSNLVRLMSAVVDKKTEFDTIKAPIEGALQARGFNNEQIEKIFGEIISGIAKKKKTVPLPQNILSSNNTRFFLQRQIKENIRYKNPFSCLEISVTGLVKEGKWHAISKEELAQVIPEICMILKGFLRDLDLIGSLGRLEEDNLLIILPMTEESGANAVKKRLDKKFLQSDFTINDKTVELNIVVSVTPYNHKKTPEYKSYKELVKTRHKIEEDMNNKL